MKRQSGFTLIELMVAMALGLIILIGVMNVLLINMQTQRVQEGISRMQESARFALEEMSINIRNAGYLGCISDPSQMVNTLNSSGGFLANFSIPLMAYDATATSWSPSRPASIISPNLGSDILSLRTATDGDVFLTKSMPDSSAAMFATPTSDIEAGDILIVTDCGASAVFQATQYNDTNGSIVHNTGGGGGLTPPNNATKNLGKRYEPGAHLLKMSMVNYYIRDSASGEGPALWQQRFSQTPTELAPNVERLHVLLGHDTDTDGVVDVYRAASDANVDWNQIVTVRLSLLMRSPQTLPIDVDSRVFQMGGEDVGPFSDRFARQLFTKTVSVRNRLP